MEKVSNIFTFQFFRKFRNYEMKHLFDKKYLIQKRNFGEKSKFWRKIKKTKFWRKIEILDNKRKFRLPKFQK